MIRATAGCGFTSPGSESYSGLWPPPNKNGHAAVRGDSVVRRDESASAAGTPRTSQRNAAQQL